MKYLSKIIREFEKLPYKSYERRRPKHEPTDSYFYLAGQLAKCMMRADDLSSHVYLVITEMYGKKQIPILHVCYIDESESEEFLVDENSLQVCSTDTDESKMIIANESYTEESESECVHKNTKKEKDTNNEAQYKEPTSTYDPVVKESRYFNIFKCENIFLNKHEATYERSCMATPKDKYHTELYRTITY